MSVGASSTVQTTKHSMPAVKASLPVVEILRGGPPPVCSSGRPVPAAPVPPAPPESCISCVASDGSSVRTVTPGRADADADADADERSGTGAGRRSTPDLPAAAPLIAAAFPPAHAREADTRPFAGARLSIGTSEVAGVPGSPWGTGRRLVLAATAGRERVCQCRFASTCRRPPCLEFFRHLQVRTG